MNLKIRIGLLLALAFPCASIADSCGIVQAGAADQTVYLRILDSTTGVPNAGRAYNDSGIDLEYVRTGAAAVDITEATQTASGAHADGGFVSVGHGNYRLDLPDAAVAAGVRQVQIQGTITGYVVVACSVDLTPSVNTTQIAGTAAAVPGASGGLLISGTNSGTTTLGALTVTGTATISDGLVVARSTSNQPAATFTGNGTGNGVTITSGTGATGTGLAVVAASTNGSALTLAGVGTGNGFTSTGGATGNGISAVGGSTSGDGLRAVATTSGNGIEAVGVGTTQAGFLATGGTTSSPGISAAGGGTGAGFQAVGGATGVGAQFTGGSTSGAGAQFTGTAGNATALNLVGQGSASGMTATGGATGHGISAVGGATSGSGLRAVAATSGNGILATGVGTTQAGIAATGGSTTSAGISATGGGTGSGILATSGSGATGNGVQFTAASTNGSAIGVTATGTGLIFSTPANVNVTQYGGGAGTFSSGRPEVLLGNLPAQCLPAMGCSAQGTLSGTHSATTADLGGSAPGATSDLVGKTLTIPAKYFSRVITAYDTGTGVATFETTSLTLANSDQWYLWETSPSSGGGGGGLDAAGVRAAIGLASANLDTQLSTIDNFIDTEVADILTDTGTTLDDLVDDLESRLGTPSNLGGGATVAGNLSDIEAQTDDIGAAGAGLTALATQASVNTIDDFLDTEVAAILADTNEVQISLAAGGLIESMVDDLQTEVDGIQADTEDLQARVPAALVGGRIDATVDGTGMEAGAVTAIQSGLATAAALATTDGVADSILVIANKLDTALVLDGAVYQYTANALELGPAGGGGGSSDWNADERTALRAILGIPASGTTPDDPTTGILDTIRDSVATRASQASVDDVPTNAELATSQAAADDATLAAIDALPTAAENATAVGDIVVEDQGGGVSLKCSLAAGLSYYGGDLSTSGSNSTYEDPSGTETRISATVASAGNRTASVTCPSY